MSGCEWCTAIVDQSKQISYKDQYNLYKNYFQIVCSDYCKNRLDFADKK